MSIYDTAPAALIIINLSCLMTTQHQRNADATYEKVKVKICNDNRGSEWCA